MCVNTNTRNTAINIAPQSKHTDYVSGSCSTLLYDVDKGMPQLPQTSSESFD